MIKAEQKDEVLLEDIRRTLGKDSGLRIWWLGQSGFLLQWQGRHLLLDPYLSDSLTRKYAQTDKPHIRMSELVIEPDRLDFIDVVTSSHNHTDHLDGETLIPLIKKNPGLQFIIPEANRSFVCDRILRPLDFPVGLNDGELVELDNGFSFFGIPAAHNELERDEAGRCRFMGYVVRFDRYAIYHSGDTLWHEDIITALQPFSIDVAILPINGNKPERRVAGNLEAEEAAAFGKRIGAGSVIPCHYDMFTFNTADPEDFRKAAEEQGQPYHILKPGEKLEIL